jgi:hypothetical protein
VVSVMKEPVAHRLVVLWIAILGIAVPALAADHLQATLAVRVRDGRDVPAKLLQEVTGHITKSIRDAQVLNTAARGPGRFVITVSLPADERLKFEKMVVELPTGSFAAPVAVESWNVNPRTESVAATEETTAAHAVPFQIDVDRSGGIAVARLREVPVKDVLSYLARAVKLQYVCPDEIADRPVWAELRNVTVEEFLKAIKTALNVELTKSGALWIFSSKETRPR